MLFLLVAARLFRAMLSVCVVYFGKGEDNQFWLCVCVCVCLRRGLNIVASGDIGCITR